jgi:C4-dicarboxylate-specific signal transduction histidine kinase
VSILGEHLISDQAVALIELVKNAYDADAKNVRLEILNPRDQAETVVIVADDGTGMTLEDIELKWLSPAADEKERAKQAGARTPLGRLPIGEKGVGRFALHQLGRSLELVTRASDSPELVVAIDWDAYDTGDGYLDAVPVEIVEREPSTFTESTGTRLTISRPRALWDEKLLRKVQRSLRRLQSPLREAELDFAISFRCPDHPELEEISPTDVLERAHYEFRAMVDETGRCDFEYVCHHPSVAERQRSGSDDLLRGVGADIPEGGPRCGPFWLNLYVWDRTRDALAASGVPRAELDAMAGVSLYRDGLRVLPYGEPGNDWLFLDQERIQAPAERIGNNQVIGLVEVDQSTNLRLRDKTNREGLIENDAFLDLRTLVRAAMRVFTAQWRLDRPPSTAARAAKADTVEGARQVTQALQRTARDDVSVDLPPRTLASESTTATGSEREDGGAPTTQTVTQREALTTLLGELDDVQRGIDDSRERFERVLHLAATGLAAERVVHEFGRQVAAASRALRTLRLLKSVRGNEALATLESVLATLQAEFRVLAPYETLGRAPRTRMVNLRELADLVLRLNDHGLREAGVNTVVEGDDFTVSARGAGILQILDNLVHNAVYWLDTLDPALDRRLGILLCSEQSTVLVADSGPGLTEEAAESAFEPFFSMKEGGSGLGLYISAELAKAAGGRLALADRAAWPSRLPPWANGAVFELSLNYSENEGNGRA